MGTENAFEVTARLVARSYEEKLAAKDAEIQRLKKIIEKMEGSNEVLYMGVKQADTRISQLEEAVRVLGRCVEARRREKIARHGFHQQEPTHTHYEWLKAIEDRVEWDNAVDANPVAAKAVEP